MLCHWKTGNIILHNQSIKKQMRLHDSMQRHYKGIHSSNIAIFPQEARFNPCTSTFYQARNTANKYPD